MLPRAGAIHRKLFLGLLVAATLTLLLAALKLGWAQKPATEPATLPVADAYTPIVPDQKATSDIEGVVRDESGNPVAGVTVQTVQGGMRNVGRRSTTTDATGRFEFPKLGPSGYWCFSVNDPRYAWEWDYERETKVPAGPDDLPIQVTIYQARTLHGTVVGDDTGKPVAGVRVVLVNEQLPSAAQPISGNLGTDFLIARTDADGRFTMPRLRPGKATFWLHCSGYANTLDQLKIDGSSEQTLTINRGRTLHGRVLHDDHPMPGVSLTAGYAESHRLMLDWHGRTDADGLFTVARIPPISAEERSEVPAVYLSVEDSAWYGDRVKVYQSADGVLPDTTIEVNPGRKPMESPLDSMNIGKPDEAPGGTVRVNLPGLIGEPMVSIGVRMQKATTAIVAFTNVPAGRYHVMVFSGISGDAARAPKIVNVVAGKTVDVAMNPGPCELRGNVRSGGQPVGGPDEYVGWFAYPPGILGIYQGSAQVRPNGTYSVDGLMPGDYELVVQGSTSMVNTFITHVGTVGPTICDLNLPTGRIDGQLIDVAQRPQNPDESALVRQLGTIQVWPRGFPPRIPSDRMCELNPKPDGTFTVEHLEPGWYTVVGYGLEGTVNIDHAGAVATAILRPAEKTGEIAGTITGRLPPSTTDPFSHISVIAFPKDELGYNFHAGAHQTTFDPKSGKYRLRDLSAGIYGIVTMGEMRGAKSTAFTWIPDIEVRAGLSCNLPITVSEGRPVDVITADRRMLYQSIPTCTGWRLQMSSGDWIDNKILQGELCLPLGRYTIEAQYGPGGAIVSQQFTVERGEGTQKIDVDGPNQAATSGPATR
jgi:Carboxypeptidase regulatory-like domain